MDYLTVAQLRGRLQNLEAEGLGDRMVSVTTWDKAGDVRVERVFDLNLLVGMNEVRLETM